MRTHLSRGGQKEMGFRASTHKLRIIALLQGKNVSARQATYEN